MSNSAAYLLLGRSGDLCTLLPVLKRQSDLVKRPIELIVSEDYAPMLEGASYVTPIVYAGKFDRPNEALAWSRRPAINCTVYGINFYLPSECWSFDREIWHRSRCDKPFGRLPLIFDNRSLEREQALADRVLPKTQKPIVLTSLRGTSSPFPKAQEFFVALKEQLPEFEVVDTSGIVAERPYDLIGLYQRASALVAIDSMPLHLSWAVPTLNTVALITDGPTPWHRTSWRPHHRLRLLYSEAHDNLGRVVAQIQNPAPPVNIRLVYSQTPVPDAATQRRLEVAKRGRDDEMANGGTGPRWTETNFSAPPGRTAAGLGDRPLPYVRDMVDQAFRLCERDDDIIVLINADIGFTPGLTGHILDRAARHGAAYAHRWDFTHISRPARSEAEVRKARWYPGSDLFVFTRRWWKQHGALFPDMLLGREAWDMVMRNLIKKVSGFETELHHAIWHERHASMWEQQPDCPGNRHNRTLAEAWLRRHGGSWNDWNERPVYL